MNIVKENENKGHQPSKAELNQLTILTQLAEAYQRGEIKLRRSLTYLRQPAKPGHIFYTISYRTMAVNENNVMEKCSIYEGAYEMTLEEEAHYKSRKQLSQYLLYKFKDEVQ